MRAAVLIGLFFLSFGAFASQNVSVKNCEVISPKARDLETGVNRNVICREAIYTLTDMRDYNPDAKLTLTVTNISTFSLDISYRFKNSVQTMRGKGILYWYPGDSYYALTAE